MRKDFGPRTWMFPMPVLIIGTYDENGTPNAMNAAWGGIANANRIAICIDKGHKTAKNFQAHKAFTVSFATEAQLNACDYVGLVSGNDCPDKLKKTGWHIRKSAFVEAPVFEELPMTLECRLLEFDPATECCLGEIVNVSADESILDGEGTIDPEKLAPVIFDPVRNLYRKLGGAAGKAFSAGNELK